MANNLVVSLVSSSELTDQSNQYQFPDLGQFGVDDSNQSRKDWSERQRRCLGTHDGPSEKASTSNQVLGKQLGDDVLDV